MSSLFSVWQLCLSLIHIFPVFLTSFDEDLDPDKCTMAVKTLFDQAKLDPGVGVIQPLEHVTIYCTYSQDQIYTLEIGDNEAILQA